MLPPPARAEADHRRYKVLGHNDFNALSMPMTVGMNDRLKEWINHANPELDLAAYSSLKLLTSPMHKTHALFIFVVCNNAELDPSLCFKPAMIEVKPHSYVEEISQLRRASCLSQAELLKAGFPADSLADPYHLVVPVFIYAFASLSPNTSEGALTMPRAFGHPVNTTYWPATKVAAASDQQWEANLRRRLKFSDHWKAQVGGLTPRGRLRNEEGVFDGLEILKQQYAAAQAQKSF